MLFLSEGQLHKIDKIMQMEFFNLRLSGRSWANLLCMIHTGMLFKEKQQTTLFKCLIACMLSGLKG